MDAGITETTLSPISAAERRGTTQMPMQPNANLEYLTNANLEYLANENWEEYLTSAPLSIAIMGDFVFISPDTDFSINKNPPPTGFKYIRNPDSFKICLMQICDSSRHAFNEAHNNMNKIRIQTARVPDYMKEADMILKGSDKVIETLLPNQLKNIRTTAVKCEELAKDVQNKYTDVTNLIQELLETCTGAKGVFTQEQDEVERELEESEIKHVIAIERNETYKKAMENSSKQLEDAKDEYKKYNDILHGWSCFMVLINIADAIRLVITGIASTFTGLIGWQSAMQTISEYAQTCIQRRQEQLRDRQDSYDKCVEKMEKHQKKLTNILAEKRNCRMKKSDLKNKIKTLKEGLDKMGSVKEQWGKIMHFFQMVSNSMEISLNKTLKDLAITAGAKNLSVNDKLIIKGLLCKQALQAANIASLVHMISRTYTEVSNKYLMDGVSGLEKLTTMDHNKPEFKKESVKLQKSCKDANIQIKQLVLKNKNEFEWKEKKEKMITIG